MCMSVSFNVSRCDSWKMCLRIIGFFFGGFLSYFFLFSADEGEEKNVGFMVDFLVFF